MSHLNLLRDVIPFIQHVRETGEPERAWELARRSIDLAREAHHAGAGRAVAYSLIQAGRVLQAYAQELEKSARNQEELHSCYYMALAYLDSTRDALAHGIHDSSARPLEFCLNA